MTPGSVCAAHPAVPASGACDRCGTFGCEQCLQLIGVNRLCAACLQRQAGSLPPLATRALLARVALYASGALGLAVGLLSLGNREETAGLLLALVSLVAVGYLGTLIAAIVIFCLWFHRAVLHAHALGIPVAASPAFAVGSWFIPFANLFVPFNVARQLSGAAPVGLWQALWITGNAASRIPEQAGALALLSPLLLLGAAHAGSEVVKAITERLASHAPAPASPAS